MRKIKNRPARLVIDFTRAQSVVDFTDALRQLQLIPADADAYATDALDFRKDGGGITPADTYIVAADGERPPGHALRNMLADEE